MAKIVKWRSTRCGECRDDFKYKYQINEEQLQATTLLIELSCPFCQKPLTVDLSPHRRGTTPVFRKGDGSGETANTFILELPDELPAELREDQS